MNCIYNAYACKVTLTELQENYINIHQYDTEQHIFPFLHTVSQKKFPTFKLSVTLSNLNRFSKFLHCWKAYEICYKTYATIPTSP